MVRAVVRQMFQRSITTDSDDLMAALWIPAGGRLIGARCQVHCIVHDVAQATGGVYGTNAFVLPVDDPDSVTLADTIWDRHVPKDITEGDGAYDLDTGTPEVAAEFAIGKPDLSGIIGTGPFEIPGGKRRKMITFANSSRAYQGASVDTYTMADMFSLNLGGSPVVDKPSVACIGFSSPVVGSTTVQWTSPVEAEWTNLQYPLWTLEQALVELLGTHEPGSESPWEDASEFLMDYLEPQSHQETAGSILTRTWLVFANTTWVMEVPGRPTMKLDSDA